jgi:ribosomal protein S20
MKDSMKEFKVAVAADLKEAEKIVPKVYKTIDKAAKKKVIGIVEYLVQKGRGK